MKAAIASDSVNGAIKLVTHLFRRDVPEAEAMTLSDAVYRIEKTATGLNGRAGGSKTCSGSTSVYRRPAIEIVAGMLLSVGVIAIGLCVFCRPVKIKA